jgi:hypothetical protein
MSTVSDITTFQDTTFAALRTSYPTWDLLSAYLKTELGLVVRTVDAHYALIHYDKTKSRMSHSLVRTFRSVVWDTEMNLPVSVTPPKSVDGEQVPAFSDPSEVDSYTVSEFYDGTLIGAFRCKYDNKVILHTRTHMPANNTYYGKKTFASMVEEAVSMDILDARIENGSCYAYVLQHPENRIVVPTTRPQLRLVQTVVIGADGLLEIPAPPPDHSPLTDASRGLPNASEVWRSQGEAGLSRALLAKVASTAGTMPFQGVVVLDKDTNTRYKVRTSHYNSIRQLRGDTANLEYVWLCHWKIDKLPDYLRIYPEEKTAANALLEQWKRYSNEIFGFYKDVFILHTLQLNQAPRKYRPLLHEMQELYKTELKPQGRRMTWHDVRTFLNNQDVPRILFVLHYKDITPSVQRPRPTVELTATGGFNIRSGDYLTPTTINTFPSPTPVTSYAQIARRGIEEFPASNAGLAVEVTHNDFD